MAEQVYVVTWECLSCGQEHCFRYTLTELGDWPNKFEDLACANPDCGHVQEVAFRKCRVEPFTLSSGAGG